MSEHYVTVAVHIKAVTPKAFLCRTGPLAAECWVPRSCVHASTDKMLDDTNILWSQIPHPYKTILVMEWIARKNGLTASKRA